MYLCSNYSNELNPEKLVLLKKKKKKKKKKKQHPGLEIMTFKLYQNIHSTFKIICNTIN